MFFTCNNPLHPVNGSLLLSFPTLPIRPIDATILHFSFKFSFTFNNLFEKLQFLFHCMKVPQGLCRIAICTPPSPPSNQPTSKAFVAISNLWQVFYYAQNWLLNFNCKRNCFVPKQHFKCSKKSIFQNKLMKYVKETMTKWLGWREGQL